MDMPQTEPGVPAPGVDPTVQELAAIDTIDGGFAWLGTAAATVTEFKAVLGGGGNLKLRDIVYIAGSQYTDACAALLIPTGDPQAAVTRPVTPLERGHFKQLRRICRLRVGLRAEEVAPLLAALGAGGGVPGVAGQAAAAATAQQAAAVQQAIAEPRIKLSSILDPTLDSELVRLPAVDIRKMFTEYCTKRGGTPSEDTEPTNEQISAMHQVVAADLVPYGDFAVLGPHGRRMVVKLTYCAYTFLPDGSWQRRELPGPPDFEHWWACYRVLRVIYLLLDIASPEVLDNYGELIRSFHLLYGAGAWFLIYWADTQMRSEQMERIRRQLERQAGAGAGGTAVPVFSFGQQLSSFNQAKPWRSVFEMAISDKLWWDEHLHRPAMLYLTNVKSAAAVTEDGTAQPLLEAGSSRARPPTKEAVRLRSRSRTPLGRAGKQKRKPTTDHTGTYSKKGQKFCEHFNSPAGCNKNTFACRDLHACLHCRQTGHGQSNCPILHPSQAPPADKGKGKGKGKDGGKGKGKGY